MANNAGQLAVLAAGYLLGRSKSIRTVLMVAGGVAYGRLTAPRNGDEASPASLLSRLGDTGIADVARDVISTTASKSLESINKNLQERSEALRNTSSSDDETSDDETSESETSESQSSEEAPEDEAAGDEAEEQSEDSEEATEETTKSGDS